METKGEKIDKDTALVILEATSRAMQIAKQFGMSIDGFSYDLAVGDHKSQDSDADTYETVVIVFHFEMLANPDYVLDEEDDEEQFFTPIILQLDITVSLNQKVVYPDGSVETVTLIFPAPEDENLIEPYKPMQFSND